MYDAINESIFELTLTVQSLVKQGWEFVEVQYGERRLGIGPNLVLRRGDITKIIYDHGELANLLEDVK